MRSEFNPQSARALEAVSDWFCRISRCATLLLLILAAAALGAFAAQAQVVYAAANQGNDLSRVAVTDEIGRHLEIPSEVSRVITLAPNLTEMVFAMGAGDRLAADTDFCDFPAAASQKPHIGGPVNPNLEQIAAMRPDLIIAIKSINRRETVDALARVGFPVYVIDPHSVDGMIDSLEHIGTLLHSQATSAPLAATLRARLSDIDRRRTRSDSRSVLFVVWTDPLISIGRNTFLADALRHAGARSVVDTSIEWPHVSLEEVIKLQPEFIVFPSAQAGDTQHEVESLRTRPGWRNLRALRERKIVVISDAINRPAPRMVDAIEQLSHELHPEAVALVERSAFATSGSLNSLGMGCACIL